MCIRDRDYPAEFSFPDPSRAALRRLRSSGWKIAVVTNGPKYQERKLEVTELGDDCLLYTSTAR